VLCCLTVHVTVLSVVVLGRGGFAAFTDADMCAATQNQLQDDM